MNKLETQVMQAFEGRGKTISLNTIQKGINTFTDLVETFNRSHMTIEYEDVLVLNKSGFIKYNKPQSINRTQALLMVIDHIRISE